MHKALLLFIGIIMLIIDAQKITFAHQFKDRLLQNGRAIANSAIAQAVNINGTLNTVIQTAVNNNIATNVNVGVTGPTINIPGLPPGVVPLSPR